MMRFLSLQPFVPSGQDFHRSCQLFTALGFKETWNSGDMAGFEKDGCRFLLQHFDNRAFAENFMVTVNVEDVDACRADWISRKIPETFGVRLSAAKNMPWGREVNLIDIAGVCWHFVQS